MQKSFSMLKIERNGAADYTLHGLPDGAGFKDPENYVEMQASSLFVNGVGFSAPGGEFSQHGRSIIVEQDTEGGRADIKL